MIELQPIALAGICIASATVGFGIGAYTYSIRPPKKRKLPNTTVRAAAVRYVGALVEACRSRGQPEDFEWPADMTAVEIRVMVHELEGMIDTYFEHASERKARNPAAASVREQLGWARAEIESDACEVADRHQVLGVGRS